METKDLVEIKPENALAVFSNKDKVELQKLINMVAAEARSHVPDVTTKKGRDAIASTAFKVVKSKTYLESVGKEVADEQKKIPKLIDAARRHLAVELDKIRDEVRKPLTDYEAVQKAIEDGKKATLQEIRTLGMIAHGAHSEDIAIKLEQAEGFTLDHAALDDYYPQCAEAKIAAVHNLKQALAAAVQYESDQAELALLREQQATATAATPVDTGFAATTTNDFSDFSDFEDYSVTPEIAAARSVSPAVIGVTSNGSVSTDEESQRAVNNVAVGALVEGGIPLDQAQQVIRLIVKGKIPNVSITY